MARGASRTPAKNTASASAGLPGWFKGAMCIALGFGIAHYFFSGKDSTAPRAPARPLSANSAPAPLPSTATKAGDEPSRPANANGLNATAQRQPGQARSDEQSFDFYTILPSSEITPSASSSDAVHPAPPPPMQARPVAASPSSTAPSAPATAAVEQRAAPTSPPATASNERYILQSLSTASPESANAVAAQLRDLGIPTQVHSAQLANGKTTYRVQSGPFTEGAERDRALGLIRVQHLNPIVMRMR